MVNLLMASIFIRVEPPEAVRPKRMMLGGYDTNRENDVTIRVPWTTTRPATCTSEARRPTSLEQEHAFAGGLGVEQPIGLVRLVKRPALSEQAVDIDLAIGDEARALGLVHAGKRPRAHDRELLAQVREHVDRSLAIASRYVQAARRVGDRRQLAIAHWICAQDYWRSGRFAEGVAEARRGRRAFDAHQPTADLVEHPEILNRTVEAYCACMLGRVGSALRDLRAMAAEAREAANPLTPERTFTVLGATHQLLRDVDQTAVVVQQMTALSQTHRRPQHGDWLVLLRAWVLTAQGDMASGVAQATSAMEGLEIKSRLPRRLSILAECFAAAGQIDTAQGLVTRALVETEARGERSWEAELHRQRGELLLAAG
ncbi:MAG: hypothetical protein ACREH6_00410, partial [Geminicoccaceae bacterium]